MRPDDCAWPGESPRLSDEQLTLRLWTKADVRAVFEACQDPDIQRWTGVPSPYLYEHAQSFVQDIVPNQWRTGVGAHFAIESSTGGAILGACGLNVAEESPRQAELGYWVVAAERGRGVAVRAARLLSHWALTEGGISDLELFVYVGNEASSRVATKAGFVFDRVVTGLFRN